MIFRIYILFIILSAFPSIAFSKSDLSDYFKNIFDNQIIKIPTGVYNINSSIDIVDINNLKIIGGGYVLIILNDKKSLFNLRNSNFVSVENIIFLDNYNHSYIFKNDIKSSLYFNGLLYIHKNPDNNSSLSQRQNKTSNSILFNTSGSFWGQSNYFNTISIGVSPNFYRFSDPTNDRSQKRDVYGSIDYMKLDLNFLSKTLLDHLANMSLDQENFGWVKLFSSEEYRTFAESNNKVLSGLEAALKKDQFDTTKGYEERVKIKKKEMIDQNIKFQKDLYHFIIKYVENEEMKYKKERTSELIALRKSLKSVIFKKLESKGYDADRNLYNISSGNYLFQCSIIPNEARQLSSVIHKSKISGFSKQDHGKIAYSDLHIIDGDNGNKYPCAYQGELEPVENKSVQIKVSTIKPKAPETTAEKQKIYFFQPQQTWRGTYTCNQGRTSLDLKVREVNGNNVAAEFDFNFNNRERGSFLLSGEFKPSTREVVFTPQRWINQNSGYRMVGMTGKISAEGKNFTGNINFSGCGSFDLSLLQTEAMIDGNLIKDGNKDLNLPSDQGGHISLTEKQKSEKYFSLVGDLVLIPSGCYQMGSNYSKETQPVHKVCVDSFHIGKTEVTQAQWQQVMGNNPSKFSGCDSCPVENVSWGDAQGYLQKLNQQTGKQFRLPTEAEWEYAARAGSKREEWEWVSTIDNIGSSAERRFNSKVWYRDNSGKRTHPVGQKIPNEFGLYDMLGNVWELCSDLHSRSGYPKEPILNPQGSNKKHITGARRVARGGSWDDSSVYHSRSRMACREGSRSDNKGLRLVLPTGK